MLAARTPRGTALWVYVCSLLLVVVVGGGAVWVEEDATELL